MAAGLRHQRRLAEFLRVGAATPFAWGGCDCCSWACAWVENVRGVAPDAELRGRYATARGAGRHIRRAGGLTALVSRCMAAAGLAMTDDPKPGDVGVVKTPQGDAMAVRTVIGWAVKGREGVLVMPYPTLQAWTV